MESYTPDKLEALAQACSQAAEEYSGYVFQEKLFNELSKDMLSALKGDLRKIYPEASETELESRAREQEAWKTFRTKQFEELRKCGIKKIKYEDSERLWQTEQSVLAYRREEFRTYTK